MKAMENKKVQAAYNPEKGWFELYMPNGDKIPNLKKVKICDNFKDTSQHGKPVITCEFTLEVDFKDISQIKID